MKTINLETSDPLILLIEPDIERDSALGVEWLRGDTGRDTLRCMGVADKDNVVTSLQKERERVGGFISSQDQLNWMIQHDDNVVGSIWVDLLQKESVPAPAVHIMIGDPSVRGKGIGHAATDAVIRHLRTQGYRQIYSRHLVDNVAATGLLSDFGFVDLGDAYEDGDGLAWQNVSLVQNG